MTFWKYILFLTIAIGLYGLLVHYLARRLFSMLSLSRTARYAIYGGLGGLYLMIGALRRIDRFTRFGTWEPVLIGLYTVMVFILFLFFLTLARDLLWVLMRLGNRILRRCTRFALLPRDPDAQRRLLQRSSRAILLAAVLMIFVGHYQAMTTPEPRHVTLVSKKIPPALSGFRMILVSDLHVGPTLKRPFVEHLVDRINAQRYDLVAIVGDISDGPWEKVGPMLAPLARLRKPVYFVPGNHEIYWKFPSWRRNLSALGVIVLTEKHVLIEHRGARLLLAGITDVFRWSGGSTHKTSNPAFALAGAPPADYRILLAHRPTAAASAREAGFDFMLSGHTHGGQFFPLTLITRLFQKHGHGLSHEGSLTLFTTRGAGFWGPPVRLFSPPEFVVLTLSNK
ncbi:metallophosphoesterase [Myxococcota bacterium]|nr:metallophosphoesterase [Myxococcota bacterium]MBU1535449.1 metallophosphoesterase [Myxococcota bacterium]